MTPVKRGRQFSQLFPDATNSVRLLVDIVEKCRHLAKVDSGTYAPREEEINLRQIAESCLGVFGREREAGLVFDLHCPAELAIVGDRLLWRHVLMNLIGNAVKFTTHGRPSGARPLSKGVVESPRVTVRIGHMGTGSVRVEVLDNGPGVAIGDQTKIFGKFAQVNRGFLAQGLGSGLGLHLSVKMIQMLRGELKLTSPLQPLGCGASFGKSMVTQWQTAPPPTLLTGARRFACSRTEFLVPCRFAERLPTRPVTPATTASAVQLDVPHARVPVPAELRILIVEDDELNCLVMKTSLEVGFRNVCGTNVHVTTTHTAEDALKAIGDTADSGFDVVVSDQHMEAVGGVLKGSELIERLVARDFDRCPILAIASANTDEHDNAAYFASGADIVWPKPYPQNAQLAKDILQIWNGKQVALTSTKRSSNKVVPMA